MSSVGGAVWLGGFGGLMDLGWALPIRGLGGAALGSTGIDCVLCGVEVG